MVQEYFKAAWEAYADKPKWFFGFQSEFSHDDHNRIGIVDDELVSFLSWLRDSGHLNQTMLVVMSDHGHRFAAIRETHQGKLEERMPFFYFRLPPWVETKYPNAVRNFRENAELLTTPFDVHETMEDILRWNSIDFDEE
jgi:phosphoglycerol transferase MdoB-like AlkP superfamily enzyme